MLLRLLLLLTLIPLAELIILLRIAARFDWPATIALVVLTGIVGAWLARREGLKVVRHIQSDLDAGRMPTDSLLDGVLILAAGLLLVTPGVLTDMVGFAMLVPGVRSLIRRRVSESLRMRVSVIQRTGERHDADSGNSFVDVVAASRPAGEGKGDRESGGESAAAADGDRATNRTMHRLNSP